MTRVCAGLVALAAVVGVGSAPTRGQDKDAKLVGKWEVSKSSELPKGSVLEFTADGKMTVLVKDPSGDLKFAGSYKQDGQKLSVKLKAGDLEIEETATIKKLTATDLALEDKDKKVDEFKRVK